MKYVQCYLDERSGWIRIFGFGLSFRNIKKSGYELTFSQRHGYNKYVKIFGYVITFLKPQNMKTRKSKGQRLGWEDREKATKVLLNENMLTGKVVSLDHFPGFRKMVN